MTAEEMINQLDLISIHRVQASINLRVYEEAPTNENRGVKQIFEFVKNDIF